MIYVHVPFCRSFCTYCSFYSEAAPRCRKQEDITRQESLFEEYISALEKRGYEIESIVTQNPDEAQENFSSDRINVKYAGGFKPIAKEVLKERPNDTMLLISGPYAFTSEVRYQVLAIMDF